MKNFANILVSTAAFAIAAGLGVSQASAEPAVTITVANVETQTGQVMIALYSEANWDGPPVAATMVPADAGTVSAILAAPEAGRYGVKLYHDVDGDGEMDTNAFGIPTEPYGFSNDAEPRMGPPAFEDAAFVIGADGASQTINLR